MKEKKNYGEKHAREKKKKNFKARNELYVLEVSSICSERIYTFSVKCIQWIFLSKFIRLCMPTFENLQKIKRKIESEKIQTKRNVEEEENKTYR